MYTILLNETNELTTSVRERIMQRSKLVDTLHFLVDPIYKGIDMSGFTVTMEYVMPVSREYKTETLVKSDALYENKLEYKLPLDTMLTKEAGKIEVQLTFTKVEMDADGITKQYVRKTSPTTITIVPIAAWSDVIADNALTALDQRLIQVDAMINAANEFNQYLYETKADNIVFDETGNYLQLTAGGQAIGNKIFINGTGASITRLQIDAEGNLVAVYSDGTQVIIGKTSGNCAGIYVPSFEGDQMTFTLSDEPSAEVLTFDIDQTNNWSEITGAEQATNYIWREL